MEVLEGLEGLEGWEGWEGLEGLKGLDSKKPVGRHNDVEGGVSPSGNKV